VKRKWRYMFGLIHFRLVWLNPGAIQKDAKVGLTLLTCLIFFSRKSGITKPSVLRALIHL
jgi:hypothetical protein